VEPLLDQLSKAEGVMFDRSILLHQRTGPWLKNLTCPLPASHEMEDRGIAEVFADVGVGCTYAIPASRRLLDESIALELRAEEIERRTVNMAGLLRAGSVTELTELSFADPLQLAPSPIEIQGYCENQEKAWLDAKAYPTRSAAVIASRAFSIAFSDGRIDQERSNAEFRIRASEAVA
jgi:hypothetical protein